MHTQDTSQGQPETKVATKVLLDLLEELSQARSVVDVNIAAGKAQQDLTD